MTGNYDLKTVAGFGGEWSRYDYSRLEDHELKRVFDEYFSIFPWAGLPTAAVGVDVGCGSGRWAKLVAPRVGLLHCIDASPEALAVARGNLRGLPNCVFHTASLDNMPIEDNSMDFGYCLGVVMCVPDTAAAIKSCAAKLKEGAPFLLYIYYDLENRPRWYAALWRISNSLRLAIARLPFWLRCRLTEVIALMIYYPLARLALLAEKLGFDAHNFPLSSYRDREFYWMRTDALDRLGTRLEKRFNQSQIREMMGAAGLGRITFKAGPPYWCVLGYKR